ncbi:hypothetical protein DEU56DRAFT_904917 [Suillus clintonianus]|uniref:uncharacterized protein n=1 Tax=Suillus clintonianus TaxID=1904413 RepID=UPI001B85C5B9|nr:uncharacterized protein DEU56DRAFT_904917 [Suillus clintonianus]KAG2119325.1 hypothetical protein DEU56DRAFT_904917 [Suillus clintonianus]
MLPISNKFVCVCEKYGLGRPHSISKSTWYEHLQQASTEEEKARIRAAEALHTYDNTMQDHSLPEQPQDDQSVASGSSLPPSSRRAAAIQTLAKRARENQDTRRVGRRNVLKVPRLTSRISQCVMMMTIWYTDDVPVPLADPDEHPGNFADQHEVPVPNNNPPITPGDVADQHEVPVPNNAPPITPGDVPISTKFPSQQ